jgi:hypothetical protein
MAKEYYKLHNQCIEFDTEARTMTVTMHDDVFTNISVHRMTENAFNGQYLLFKANMFKSLSDRENADVMALSDQDKIKLAHIPEAGSVESFNEVKSQALDFFQNSI